MSDRTRTVHRTSPAAADAAANAAPSSTEEAAPPYELVDLDRYAVRDDDGIVGFVEVVPPLFVCYAGTLYPKSVEIAQAYDFHEAVRVVIAHAAAARRRRTAL